jgi:predicted negative regulator of RcsB-dependent stress response
VNRQVGQLAAHPGDPRAELALLDLARLALAAGHPVEARSYLKRFLAATNDAALVELGRQIQHRIDAAAAP